MDAQGFLSDLEQKPAALARLAGLLADDDPWRVLPVELAHDVDEVLLLGMGSSTYAASVAAGRLRLRGLNAHAELSSTALLPEPHARRLVLAISASGASTETLEAVRRHAGVSPVVAVVNSAGTPLSRLCDATVEVAAGPETGGVACRSFQHTLAVLLALRAHAPREGGADERLRLAESVRRAAVASEDLLQRRDAWLPEAVDRLAGPAGTWVVAPAHRLSSAHQSALMLREGPRRPAVACETGDWSHVDVYLTKTLDYRMLLLPGSAYEAELLRWTLERGSTVVAAGGSVDGAAMVLRYRHDTDDDVRLLAEVLVAELVSQQLWSAPR